jgi:hypothetical protein
MALALLVFVVAVCVESDAMLRRDSMRMEAGSRESGEVGT